VRLFKYSLQIPIAFALKLAMPTTTAVASAAATERICFPFFLFFYLSVLCRLLVRLNLVEMPDRLWFQSFELGWPACIDGLNVFKREICEKT